MTRAPTAMAGSAAVYNAAFARAGLVRVTGLGELFDAAETLGYGISPRTERLVRVLRQQRAGRGGGQHKNPVVEQEVQGRSCLR